MLKKQVVNFNVNVEVPISFAPHASVHEHQGRTAHEPNPDNLGSNSRHTTPSSNSGQYSMSKEVHQIYHDQNHNHYHHRHSHETSMSMDGQRVITRQIMEKEVGDACAHLRVRE